MKEHAVSQAPFPPIALPLPPPTHLFSRSLPIISLYSSQHLHEQHEQHLFLSFWHDVDYRAAAAGSSSSSVRNMYISSIWPWKDRIPWQTPSTVREQTLTRHWTQTHYRDKKHHKRKGLYPHCDQNKNETQLHFLTECTKYTDNRWGENTYDYTIYDYNKQ